MVEIAAAAEAVAGIECSLSTGTDCLLSTVVEPVETTADFDIYFTSSAPRRVLKFSSIGAFFMSTITSAILAYC